MKHRRLLGATLAENRPWAPTLPAVIAFVLYAVVAASFAPYTWPMRVATGAACLVVAAAAVRRERRRRRRGEPPVPGRRYPLIAHLVWLVLLAALVTFLLLVFFSAPRQVYPTLSSLASDAFATPGVRAAAFASWLWLGWYIGRR